MARLPQSLDMQGPNGATASGRAVSFDSLDNALQSVASEVQRFDQTRKAVDDQEASRMLARAEAEYAAEAQERWQAWDAREPGQEAREAEHWQGKLAPLLDDPSLSDGVRDSARRLGRDLTVRIEGQAIATAAQGRAQRFALDRDNAERMAAVSVMQTGMARWHEREAALRQSLPADADWHAAYTSAWDAFVEGELAPHPERVRALAAPQFLAERGRMQMDVLTRQDRLRDATTAANISTATNALLNRIQRDPSVRSAFDREIREIASGLPQAAQATFIAEQTERADALAVDGRLAAGGLDGVEADLAAGRFDHLAPAVLETARGNLAAARSADSFEKALQRADVTERFQRNLTAIARGEAPDLSLLSEANGLFDPDEVADMLLQQQAASRLQPFMRDLYRMNPAQGEAALVRLEGEAATEAERKALEAVRADVRADLQRRATDPALAAMTPAGAGDTVRANVRAAFETLSVNPTPELAQRYATAALQVQGSMGVAVAQRRILPTERARELVAGLEQPGADAAANLSELWEFVGQFGPYAPRVMVDLAEAGLTNRALGAMMHYADQPQMLAYYTAGLAATGVENASAIREAVVEGTADYARTAASGEGLEATRAAAITVMTALVARGESLEDAKKIALRPIVDQYVYGEDIAIPKAAGVDARRWERDANDYLGTLIAGDMAQLEQGGDPRLNADQNRRILRDRIGRGRWVLNPRETGAVFVIETFDADGAPQGPRPLAMRDGTPVTREWNAPPPTQRRSRDWRPGRFGAW